MGAGKGLYAIAPTPFCADVHYSGLTGVLLHHRGMPNGIYPLNSTDPNSWDESPGRVDEMASR